MGCIDSRRCFEDEDRYAVAIAQAVVKDTCKDDTVVGHIPRKISRICSLFLARSGVITSMPIGEKRYSSHLQLNIFTIISVQNIFKCNIISCI